MRPQEATKVRVALRLIEQALDYKGIRPMCRANLNMAKEVLVEALEYQDDEPARGCTDD